MRGTPCYVMGDELGVTSAYVTNSQNYRGIKTANYYHELAVAKGNTAAFLADQKTIFRDHTRTPWLKKSPNYASCSTGPTCISTPTPHLPKGAGVGSAC